MTTYTFQGFEIDFGDENGVGFSASPTSLSITAEDSGGGISYSNPVLVEDEALPLVDIDYSELLDFQINGTSTLTAQDLAIADAFFGFVTWSEGTSIVLQFIDPATAINYFFIVDGPVPDISLGAFGFLALESTVTDGGEITSGDFAPDTEFHLSDLSTATISEDDTWTGTSADETVALGDGDDVLTGNGGDDDLFGGRDDDDLFGGGGGDDLSGGRGSDDLFGGAGTDSLSGDGGDDDLHGGGAGDDLFGGGGNDTLFGGSGRDDLFGGGVGDDLYGGSGSDSLFGGGGEDILYGGNGNDRLRGGNNDDLLEGGAANDDLDGGNGDDDLIGGSGDDDLTGGAGSDTFVFTFGLDQGDNVIEDFEDGIDTLFFVGIDGTDDLTIAASGSDVSITWDDGSILIENTDVANITEDDFTFLNFLL